MPCRRRPRIAQAGRAAQRPELLPLSAPQTSSRAAAPPGANAALALADGSLFWGRGTGARGTAVGEVCFNTSMTGYQEIVTDPSYAGQLIAFTFPHIGNVGANEEDVEAAAPAARGVILETGITAPSSFRASSPLAAWLERMGLPGIAGIDCRRLTRRIRDGGPQTGALCHAASGAGVDVEALHAEARAWPGLEGMDLAREVSCRQSHRWDQAAWSPGAGYAVQGEARYRVVAVDFGAKRNILRSLAAVGCAVTVVPAETGAEEILERRPHGVLLSNGPGDPAATGAYAVPMIRALLSARIPLFGICLGFQMLAIALGAGTRKMFRGHRGANHPVKDLATGRVEITSQNHGFEVDASTLPAGVRATHVSLFDGSLEGLSVEGRAVFGVQYHPEASPGPQDSAHLFDRFAELMAAADAAS